jgi:hypothetical protein
VSETPIILPVSNNLIDKPLPEGGNHLIYSYFVESTNIIPVFGALFSSFFVSDNILKLSVKDDKSLIETIKETVNEVFAKPVSSITPSLEEARYNAYWRVFGYKIQNSNSSSKTESVSKTEVPTSNFNELFSNFLLNISLMILDLNNTNEKVGDPNTTASYANKIKTLLDERITNTIQHVADDSAAKLGRLIMLLEDPVLLPNRLSIRSEDPVSSFQRLSQRLNVPIPQESSDLFLLAGRMHTLLTEIQARTWTASAALELATIEKNQIFFKGIEASWTAVTKKSIMLAARRSREPGNKEQ